MKKRRSIFAYVIIAFVGLCLCSVIATALNRGLPASVSPGSAPALAPVVTIFATQPAPATATVAPTATTEPTATDMPPTITTAPTDAPLPTVEPATPTAQIEAPTALPVAPVPALPPLLSANATGTQGNRSFVDPAWLPCQQGQIKGNASSDPPLKYHVPSGAHYRYTFTDIRCFNTEAEAQAGGFVRSGN